MQNFMEGKYCFFYYFISYESIIGGSLASALSELVEGCPKKLVNEKIPPN